MNLNELTTYFDGRYSKTDLPKEPEQTGDNHAEHSEALRQIGVNNYTCSNCGPLSTGSSWKESDYHDCPECNANRVLNSSLRCPWCGENQNEDDGK